MRAGGGAVPAALTRLAEDVDALHVHIDLDVHDTSIAPANSYATPGGLGAEEVRAVVRQASRRLPIASATLASWDPELDHDGRMRAVALDLLEDLGIAFHQQPAVHAGSTARPT